MDRQASVSTRRWLMIGLGLIAVALVPSGAQRASADFIPTPCVQVEQVIATMADGYVAFVNSTPIKPQATQWPEDQIKTMEKSYGNVILNGYASPKGLGSLETWAQEFGLERVPAGCPGPNCCHAGGALRFMYVPGQVNRANWYDLVGIGPVPGIQTGCDMADCPNKDVAYHELAHIWDMRKNGTLGTELDAAMQVKRDPRGKLDIEHYYGRKPSDEYWPDGIPPVQKHGDFPTAYFGASGEHWAETMAAYFLIDQGDEYYYAVCWTDEDPRCPSGERYEYDRYDFVKNKLLESRQMTSQDD